MGECFVARLKTTWRHHKFSVAVAGPIGWLTCSLALRRQHLVGVSSAVSPPINTYTQKTMHEGRTLNDIIRYMLCIYDGKSESM